MCSKSLFLTQECVSLKPTLFKTLQSNLKGHHLDTFTFRIKHLKVFRISKSTAKLLMLSPQGQAGNYFHLVLVG